MGAYYKIVLPEFILEMVCNSVAVGKYLLILRHLCARYQENKSSAPLFLVCLLLNYMCTSALMLPYNVFIVTQWRTDGNNLFTIFTFRPLDLPRPQREPCNEISAGFLAATSNSITPLCTGY